MTTPTDAVPSPHPRPFLLVQTRPEDDAAAVVGAASSWRARREAQMDVRTVVRGDSGVVETCRKV